MIIRPKLFGDLSVRLMVTANGYEAAAGPRLFRAPPHPDIKFGEYPSIEAAEKDAVKLQQYLDALPVKKLSKDKLRSYRDEFKTINQPQE